MERLQHGEGLFGCFYSLPHFFYGPVVLIEVLVPVVEYLRNRLSEFRVRDLELYYDLAAYIFNLLVIPVIPTSQLANHLEIVGDRSPSLLPGLEAIALFQIVARLHDKPATDGPAVVGALEPRIGQRR